MTAIVRYKTTTKDNGVELAEGTVTNAIKVDATATNVINLAAGAGGTESAFTNDTIGTTAEDGFITIVVNGSTYKIPFWADD